MAETDVDVSALPDGWVWTTLEEISEIILGQSPPSSTYNTDGKGLPFYQGKLEFGKTYPTPRKWCTVPKKIAKKGDVFISVRAPVGPTNICPEKSCVGRGLAAIRGLCGIQSFFILYLMRTFEYEIAGKGMGTTFNAIKGDQLKTFEIPLPPLPEQNHIAAKIEELFTKLDAGKEELLQAKARLKRYRQSVLKAAMEGKLTEDWRKKHGDEIEPASVLLDRILKDRREKWEAEQLEQMSAKGKIPKDDKWKNKYKEPLGPDTSKLPNLPDGWVWVTIEQLSYKVQYGSSSKCTADENGIPVFRMGNILDGKLIINDLKYLPQDHNEFPNLLLETGDILFNRTNSAELVGKTAVYKGLPTPCSFASYLIRVKATSGIFPEIISYYINSTYGRQWIASVVSQQVGQANVNGTKLQALAVPLPPYLEQEQFISEVEKHLSVADAVEATVDAELKRSDTLRQSILKQAFSGKLVPQDPNDEPAEKLLERIKKEKTKREAVQKTNSKTKKQLVLFEH